MPTFDIHMQFMINPRGRLVRVNMSEVPLRRSQGWKIINNPKSDYFAEFDLGEGGRPAPDNLADDISDQDVLPFEFV